MYSSEPHRRRLAGRLMFLALIAVLIIAVLHLIAWALAPVLWIGLVGGIFLLAIRRR